MHAVLSVASVYELILPLDENIMNGVEPATQSGLHTSQKCCCCIRFEVVYFGD